MPNPEGINQYTGGGGQGSRSDAQGRQDVGARPANTHAHPAAGTEHASSYGQARAKADHASRVDAESRRAGSRRPTLARAAYHAHKEAEKEARAAGDEKGARYHSDRASYHSVDIPAKRGSDDAQAMKFFRTGGRQGGFRTGEFFGGPRTKK